MKLSAEELAREISNFVNGAHHSDVEELAKLMANDHPTLQQNKMRLVCGFIEQMANKSYVDARNQKSHTVAKAMIKGYKEGEKKEIIDREGFISESLTKYIDEESLPSKGLPLI
jgi:hypothetical protein